jgi:hypothetical protein
VCLCQSVLSTNTRSCPLLHLSRLLQQSAALPLTSRHVSSLGAGSIIGSSNAFAWKRGILRRKKKTEEEVQEESRNKVLFSSPSGRELKSKDLEKLSEEDFHRYMKDHVDRLDHAEANKLAKHLEKKVAKHSQIRANALDAIHAQLKKEEIKAAKEAQQKAKEVQQKAFKYDTSYEKAHWDGNYEKTAELAKDQNPTIDQLHKVITESQHKIEKLHGVSKDLNEHVKDLWWKHKAEREAQGKNVNKSVDKTLRDAHETAKKIDMYPNVKKTWEEQEAKKAEEAAKKAKEDEEKAARKASRSGSAFSKIGSYLGIKSPSRNSNASGSSNSNSSSNGSRTSTEDSNRSGRELTSDESDGSVRSSATGSPMGSPNSVLPGNSSQGPFVHRKSVG